MKPPSNKSVGPLAALAAAQDILAETAPDMEERKYRLKEALKLRAASRVSVH
jgi:hypothetical protein